MSKAVLSTRARQQSAFKIEIYGFAAECCATEMPVDSICKRLKKDWFEFDGDESASLERRSWHQLDNILHTSGPMLGGERLTLDDNYLSPVFPATIKVISGGRALLNKTVTQLVKSKEFHANSKTHNYIDIVKSSNCAIVVAIETSRGCLFESEQIYEDFDISKLVFNVDVISLKNIRNGLTPFFVTLNIINSLVYNGVKVVDLGPSSEGKSAYVYVDATAPGGCVSRKAMDKLRDTKQYFSYND